MKVSGGFVCGVWFGLSACQAALDLDDYAFEAPSVPSYSGSGGAVGMGGANTSGANTSGISGAGNGGVAQAGTAGSAGANPEGSAGAAGMGPATGSLQIRDGYATNGPFHGYSYTFIVSSTDPAARPVTVSPVCDDSGCVPAFDGNAICANGVVGSAPDFASGAYAGMDLNQDQETGVSGSVTLAGQSLVLTFSNVGASELRIQLVTPDGTAYCHSLDQLPSPAVLPFGEFETACWDDAGTPFAASSPVLALHLVVPSLGDVDVPFDFCLLDVATR